MFERVSTITFEENDLASPNFVCHFIYAHSRSSLFMGDLDLLLKVTCVNVQLHINISFE